MDRVAWAAGQSFRPVTIAGDLPSPSDIAEAQWVILAPPSAFAHPELAAIIREATSRRWSVDIFYADTALLHPDRPPTVRLKTGLDRTQLMARDYLGPLLVVRAAAFGRLGGLRAEARSAGLYDLVWRALDLGLRIDRITEVLAALPAEQAEATLDDRLTVLRARIAASGAPLQVCQAPTAGVLQVERTFNDPPPVTIVIPTMQSASPSGPPYLATLLDTLEKTDWPMSRLNVLVGDDTEAAEGQIYRPRPYALQRLATPRPAAEPFNFARKMNLLCRNAGTEHLVLMNDDVEVVSPGWLKALMTFAVEPDVGAVGARLLFPSGRLQHAGVVGGLMGLCAHPWLDQPSVRATYDDWAVIQREWSAVTGAVLATRRSALARVNGFDERFSLDFNDVDLCFKLRTLGLRIVYTPAAELIHHEKVSRGDHLPRADEQAIFLRRWLALLDNDPAIHPKLALHSYDLAPAANADPEWFGTLRGGG
jgi:hypothetical protein